jgi:TonB family protein
MHAQRDIVIGGLFFFGGLIITFVTYSAAEGGGSYVVTWGAIAFGLFQMVRGFMALAGSGGGDDEVHYEGQRFAASGGNAPTQTNGLAVRARLISGEVSADDYPPAAVRAGAEGRSVVGFTVSETGMVSDVHVAESSGRDDLDRAACRVIEERFSYSPARDSDGNPISETRTQSIAWQLS